MEMVRLTLTDGTQREMTRGEADLISLKGMFCALDGKGIVNVEFYSESDT